MTQLHREPGSGHTHVHAHPGAPLRALLLALAITGTVFLAELVGGLLTGSMALVADAMHMLSDAAGLIIAVVAVLVGKRAVTAAATYGYRRVEVLAALVNAVTVMVISVWIVVEAVRRMRAPVAVEAGPMMLIALIGLVANAASALLLRRQRGASINVEGAFLHVLVDLLGSVAVLVAGAVVALTGWNGADVLASLLIAALVVPRAWQLMSQSGRVLLEQVPRGVDLDRVRTELLGLPGVVRVHDLHVWSLDGTGVLCTAHLVVGESARTQPTLREAHRALRECGVGHSTIQIERAGQESVEGPENVC